MFTKCIKRVSKKYDVLQYADSTWTSTQSMWICCGRWKELEVPTRKWKWQANLALWYYNVSFCTGSAWVAYVTDPQSNITFEIPAKMLAFLAGGFFFSKNTSLYQYISLLIASNLTLSAKFHNNNSWFIG